MIVDLLAVVIIISIVFSLLIFHLEKDFKAERADLYNRIMAGSLQDYERGTHSTSPRTPVANGIKKTMDSQYESKKR